MYYMFCDCSRLKSFDLKSFNAQSFTEMGGMFCGWRSLTSLNLPSFNAQNVTDIKEIFNGCSFTNMGDSCNSLSSVNVSLFN